MDSCTHCSCEDSSAPLSRREVLAAFTAAAIALPVLVTRAHAQAGSAMADESGTWLKTVKPADLKDKSAKLIQNDSMVTLAILTRDGQSIMALSPKCTHKGSSVKPVAGQQILACPQHRAEFDFTGKNTAGPHKAGETAAASLKPLARYSLRLNAEGVIEVDTSRPVDKDDKNATLTVAA